MESTPFTMGVLAVIGVTFLVVEWRLRKRFLHRIQSQHPACAWGPEGVLCFGIRPESVYSQWFLGALSVVDGKLIFTGQHRSKHNVHIPLAEIYGLASCWIRVSEEASTAQKKAIEIHTEVQGQWRVYVFGMDDPCLLFKEILGAPQRVTKTQILPKNACLMRLDTYGEWHQEAAGEVYLAPDRIVFNWKSLVRFADIYHISILKHNGLLGRDLVRIESNQGVIGLLMRGANQWVTMVHPAGRKKKESE